MTKVLGKIKGSVLILTLFIVFFLSGIALSISHAMRINTKFISRYVQNQKSLNIAESAVLLALAEIKADKKDNAYDCLQDGWYRKFHDSDSIKIFRFKDSENNDIGEYSIKIVDEYSKMNINTGSEEIIDNVIDQISKKDNKKIGQAIIDYRKSLGQRQIISVYELLKIKLIDKDLFWGEDTNDNLILDKWEDDQSDSLPNDNANRILDLGLKDFLTVYTDGKINLNTVLEKNILCFPGMTEQGVQTIVRLRDNQPFQTEKDFENIGSISQQTSQFILHWGTVRSNIFRIIVRARVNQSKNYSQIIAIVDRNQDPIKILYWREN